MKYLIMASPKESAVVEPKTAVAIWKSAKAWIDKMLTDGEIDCHYVYPEGGGFAITNADSPEEVFDRVVSYPAHMFFYWEVKALCDWVQPYNTTISRWTQAASRQ